MYVPDGFVTTRTDEWGNVFVECPVCEGEFKTDGIRKHILQQCKAEKKEEGLVCRGHCNWQDKHPVRI